MRKLLFYVTLLLLFHWLSGQFFEQDLTPPEPGEVQMDDLGSGRLAPPSNRDERIIIAKSKPQSSTGTAFAYAPGQWLSARHVVENCDRLYLLGTRSTNGSKGVARITVSALTSPGSDLALIHAKNGGAGFPLLKSSDVQNGQRAFMLGYPQGNPGELHARLMGRGRALYAGARRSSEPVLIWAETGRSHDLVGSVGGISGGPAFNAFGKVIGVTVAETPRRGRIYTAAPRSIHLAISRWGAKQNEPKAAGVFSTHNLKEQARFLRRSGRVVKVYCQVE